MDSPAPVALLAGSLRSASPVLVSVSGLSALVPVVQVCLRAARVFCLVTMREVPQRLASPSEETPLKRKKKKNQISVSITGGRFPFCWLCLGLRVSSPSFHSPRPRSLSLSALLAPASRPGGFPGWGLCLSWLLS